MTVTRYYADDLDRLSAVTNRDALDRVITAQKAILRLEAQAARDQTLREAQALILTLSKVEP